MGEVQKRGKDDLAAGFNRPGEGRRKGQRHV
jgi:hypothetical protein